MKKRFLDTARYQWARTGLFFHSVRVDSTLAMWHLPDSVVRIVRGTTRAQWVTFGLIAAAIITPTGLYVKERVHHAEMTRAYRGLSFSSGSEVATLRHRMGSLLDEQQQLRSLLLDSGYAVYSDNQLAIPAVATGYSSSVIETDDTPFITASNTRTRVGIVALSRDLLRRYTPGAPFDFGDTVHISGVGDFIVEDSMHWRWRRRVDVWFPSRPSAFAFGRREVIIRTSLSNTSDTAMMEWNSDRTPPGPVIAPQGIKAVQAP